LRAAYPVTYRDTAEKYYDDWRLALSVMKAESDFNVNAKSSAGACGLMQLLPEIADFIAERERIETYDLFIPDDNIRLGCAYLRYLQGKFSDLSAVLAAYNAGEGTVREWLKNEAYSSDGVILRNVPYAETKGYMKKIKKYYTIYRKIYLTNLGK
jgi:soluble lytic murein transglycosylase